MEAWVADLARRWGFVAKEELAGGHCSRVWANATQVLKVPWQGEEATHGWRLAVAISGQGGPEIVQVDEETGAMLMERVWPGTKLSDADVSDAEAMEVVLELAAQIQRTPAEGLLAVSSFVDTAAAWYGRLASGCPRVALHGDLHHDNILHGPRGWVAIDPKGLSGPASFETSAYLRNPLSLLAKTSDLRSLTRERLGRLRVATGYSEWEMLAWAWLALGSDEQTGDWSRLSMTWQEMLTTGPD